MLLLEATNSKRLIFEHDTIRKKVLYKLSPFMTLHCLTLVYSILFYLFMFGSGRIFAPALKEFPQSIPEISGLQGWTEVKSQSHCPLTSELQNMSILFSVLAWVQVYKFQFKESKFDDCFFKICQFFQRQCFLLWSTTIFGNVKTH